jgi:hypothetical protein
VHPGTAKNKLIREMVDGTTTYAMTEEISEFAVSRSRLNPRVPE